MSETIPLDEVVKLYSTLRLRREIKHLERIIKGEKHATEHDQHLLHVYLEEMARRNRESGTLLCS